MSKNFVQPGSTITLLAPAAVVSGQAVIVGKFFGVAAYNAAINTPVEVTLDGVWTLPKVAGAITQGALLY
jgi:predicted RecA/RadA family phage recombinase